MPPPLHSVLTFSPFAFAAPELEQAYHKFLTAYGFASAWTVFSVTVLGWACVAFTLQVLFPGTADQVLNPAIYAVAVASALVNLAVLKWRPQAYRRYWQAMNAIQQLIHGGVGLAIWKEMLRSYAAAGLRPKPGPWYFHFLREFMIEQPWGAIQAILAFCLHLYVVPHLAVLTVQLAIHMAQIPWYCGGPASFPHLIWRFPELSALIRTAFRITRGVFLTAPKAAGVGELGPPDAYVLTSSGLIAGRASDLAVCTAQMAFWQVQAVIISITLTLVRELVLRRSFLTTNARRMGWEARRLSRQWPFHRGSQFVRVCTGLALILLLTDIAILRLTHRLGFGLA